MFERERDIMRKKKSPYILHIKLNINSKKSLNESCGFGLMVDLILNSRQHEPISKKKKKRMGLNFVQPDLTRI